MCGVGTDHKTCDIILQVQNALAVKGVEFSLQDAVRIEVGTDEKYAQKEDAKEEKDGWELADGWESASETHPIPKKRKAKKKAKKKK